MDEVKIAEIREKLFTLLADNGFEKKLNSREPFTFSYTKRGQSFELKLRFSENDFEVSPVVATLTFPRFELKSEIQFGYDCCEMLGGDLLNHIYQLFANQYRDFLFREIKNNLARE